MQTSLLNIIQRTTQHVKDYAMFQSDEGNKESRQAALIEVVKMLFEQFKCVAQAHLLLLKNFMRASKTHKVELQLYDTNFFWSQVQIVVSVL